MMTFNLKALPIAISLAMLPSIAIANDAADEKIAKLEQQVQALQAQQNASLTDKVKFNGFISGAYISSNNDAGLNNASSSANFDQDSKFGFQSTFNISDRTQAVLQLMMRGSNDWEVEAEWAYLSHRFENGIQIRGGKLRLPFFMYSDYLDVGYAHITARPNIEVYSEAPSSYTGADISYDFDLDDSTVTVQAYGGENEDDTLTASDLIGANVTWTDEVLTLRAAYVLAQLDGAITTDTGYTLIELNDETAAFIGLGASYDNGEFIAITEFTRTEVDGAFKDSDSGYLTLGYRIKALTPYATVSYHKSKDNEERAANPIQTLAFNAERMSYSLGLRWDAIDNVAIKFDLTYADDFGDTSGGLLHNGFDTSTGKFTYEDTLMYTVKFDAVF
ncbi:porin [Shewanella sp. A14]